MDNVIIEKEIDGLVYKARYKGVAFSIELNEKAENDLSSFELAEILFKEILVSPKVEIDDFEDMETYSKVWNFLWDIANGVFDEKLIKKIKKSKMKQKAKDNWAYWRLIFAGRGFDYQTVFGKPFMSPQDVAEANCALDMQLEAEKNAAKRK